MPRPPPCAAGEEAPDAVADVVIDGAIGREQGSIAEVRRPTAKKAVQFLAHLRPDAHFARLQQLADLALDPLQALLRGTRAKIELAVQGVSRPERVAQEVEVKEVEASTRASFNEVLASLIVNPSLAITPSSTPAPRPRVRS